MIIQTNLPSYEEALRDPAKARMLFDASKGGNVRGITEDHRYQLAVVMARHANDNTAARAPVATFAVGKTYGCRSIVDHDCIFRFEVVARTEKMVSLKNSSGKVTRRKIRISDNTEACDPHGRYSMSPVLTADSKL